MEDAGGSFRKCSFKNTSVGAAFLDYRTAASAGDRRICKKGGRAAATRAQQLSMSALKSAGQWPGSAGRSPRPTGPC